MSADSATRADQEHLEEAARLGRRGWGEARPNPLVGCVVVQDGEVVGKGWHARFGGPHAEAHALAEAGERARGADVYVSLEPCNHVGKTPPCAEALRAAGVSRVVFGAADPGAVSGGGGRFLREAGVQVLGPLFDLDRARAENPAFFHWSERARPFVAIKLAQTLDGRIAVRGNRTPITGPAAERTVHDLRRGFDAVMVGSHTARIDDPRLTVRHGPPPTRPPARIVLDSAATLDPAAALFRDLPDAPLHVFVGPNVPAGRKAALERAGAQVHAIATSTEAGDGLDLRAALSAAAGIGIRSVLCEGGGRLASAFLRAGLAERIYLLVAPWVMGGDHGVPGLAAPAGAEAWREWRIAAPPQELGPDIMLTYRRTY